MNRYVKLTNDWKAVRGKPGLTDEAIRSERASIDNQLNQMFLPVVRILEQVAPDQVARFPQWPTSRSERATIVSRTIGVLRTRREMEAILGPQGPTLQAHGLHEWVWTPAAPLWDDEHHREALQKAATSVDTETMKKVGRTDVSGVRLAQQAWSTDPPKPGKARLRPSMYRPGDARHADALNGARAFHEGCMARIRNVATHELTMPDEQEALEMLAVLSVLARWIDEADVESVENPSN